MNRKLRTAVIGAMLAAMTCIATLVIRIPTPVTHGYVNIGDAVVLIGAWILGNPYGALAAGIGSALADLLAGYASYVPGTFIIKFIMAFVCFITFRAMTKRKVPVIAAYIVSSTVAELIMVLGYFVYESSLLGYGLAAAASVPGNAGQGVTCMVLGNALILALVRVRYIREVMN